MLHLPCRQKDQKPRVDNELADTCDEDTPKLDLSHCYIYWFCGIVHLVVDADRAILILRLVPSVLLEENAKSKGLWPKRK